MRNKFIGVLPVGFEITREFGSTQVNPPLMSGDASAPDMGQLIFFFWIGMAKAVPDPIGGGHRPKAKALH